MSGKSSFSVVIRTLGNGGHKYQALLQSIASQSIPAKEVIIVIANGFTLPQEQLGYEKFIFSDKGMVNQRAAGIAAATQPFVLLLDDDVSFESDFVERLLSTLEQEQSDVVVPLVKEENHFVMFGDMQAMKHAPKTYMRSLFSYFTGIRILNPFASSYGMQIARTGGYIVSLQLDPKQVYAMQTSSGALSFGKRSSFLDIDFCTENWLDEMNYALPEDQVMFYKLHCKGHHIVLEQNAICNHLDAGGNKKTKKNEIMYTLEHNNIIFWHRFIYSLSSSYMAKLGCCLALARRIYFTLLFSTLSSVSKGDLSLVRSLLSGYKNGFRYLRSATYKALPPILS